MKILLAGGGTGGHFYPLIAVAESLKEKAREQKILDPQFFYMAPTPYDPRALFENNITYRKTSAGKMRNYFSLLNVTDFFKTLWGTTGALIDVFNIYPDVVFGKGGYASFPALLAARIFRIPVVIHESDSTPGRVNRWAGKFARRIAISYPEAAKFFPKEKVAYTGNPIRKEIEHPLSAGAHEFLKLEEGIPTILFLGGSQGSQFINESLMDVLPQLLTKYQIIHQTGKANLKDVEALSQVILKDSPNKNRYRPYGYLDNLTTRMAAGVADLIVSRAGSAIFEIAAWGAPSIIIPLPTSISHDQTSNAFSYARSGAASVIEQPNLTPHILASEITRLMNDAVARSRMKQAATAFAKLDAADKIAEVIIEIALEHEK